MRIATFNANSIRSRLETILNWLATHQPDVLCIQETKAQDHDFPQAPILDAGYQVVFKGEKSYNGVAILSRRPLEDVHFGFDKGEPRDESRLIRVRVKDVSVVTTYVPQGRELDHPMYAYKQEWFARLRELFDRCYRADEYVVWTGDLNVARDAIDVHHPEEYENHVCYHIAARTAFENCLQWGFTDVYRKHHPEPGRYSFFDYRTPNAVKRGIGWRLDYILASPSLAEKNVAAEIDLAPRLAPKASDHTFVYADFNL